MGAYSSIEWCHHTFNGHRGCAKISPGCEHCYAWLEALRFPKNRGTWGVNGTRVVAAESMWRQPEKWDRLAALAGERHRVFCSSLADVLEEWDGQLQDHREQFGWIDQEGRYDFTPWSAADVAGDHQGFRPLTLIEVRTRLFALIRKTPNLDYLLVTKRPENAERMLPGTWLRRQWPANVWFGVTVEDRKYGLPRIDAARAVPASIRFLSVEPLLEDLGQIDLTGIHWVIVGGESGPGARPMDPRWARSIRQQCNNAGVAFFFKQWGEWCPSNMQGDCTISHVPVSTFCI